MSTGTNVILPMDAAMRAYETRRAEIRRAGHGAKGLLRTRSGRCLNSS